MKRQILAVAITGLMAFGGTAAVAGAHHADGHNGGPGPNGSNNHGLCTAFFNGQKNGHEKQRDRNGEYPGPFQSLVDTAYAGGDYNEDGETNDDDMQQAVYDYCLGYGIGGNPDQNGRFTECFDDDDCSTEPEEA